MEVYYLKMAWIFCLPKVISSSSSFISSKNNRANADNV